MQTVTMVDIKNATDQLKMMGQFSANLCLRIENMLELGFEDKETRIINGVALYIFAVSEIAPSKMDWN